MTTSRPGTLAVSALVALVLVVIGYGLYLSGSPSEARLRRLDERRVDDLRSLRSLTNAYWSRHGRLPSTSRELLTADTTRLRDPVSGEPYPYRVTGDSTYELCARFDRASEDEGWGPRDAHWRHLQGEHCYPFTARKGTESFYY